MVGVWSTHADLHFISSLACNRFGQTQVMFYVLAGMNGVWSTCVEMHFESSLAWEGLISTS
jgi:hypothetical protein